MHLVGLGFHPVEEAFDAIPVAGLPEGFEFVGGEVVGLAVAVVNPVLLVLGEIFDGALDVDVALLAVSNEVALALAAALALEGFDGSLGDGKGLVGDGFFEGDADDAAEATAFRAGT